MLNSVQITLDGTTPIWGDKIKDDEMAWSSAYVIRETKGKKSSVDLGADGWTILTYLLTYLLTPRCRVLPEHLTGLRLVKKFPAFHGTPRFITALTSVRRLSLSWASPIQSIYPHPTSWRSVLIFHPSTPRSPQWSLSLRFPHQDPIMFCKDSTEMSPPPAKRGEGTGA